MDLDQRIESDIGGGYLVRIQMLRIGDEGWGWRAVDSCGNGCVGWIDWGKKCRFEVYGEGEVRVGNAMG